MFENEVLNDDLRLIPSEYRSLNEVIYSKLKDLIIAGRLRPGTRLLETELAASLGTSRSPVREAIYRLENDGLVQVKPRVGAWVTVVTRRDAEESYRIYGDLEVLAVKLAFENGGITPERLRVLDKLVDDMEDTVRSRDKIAILGADTTFHNGIVELSDSRLLKGTIQGVLPTVLRTRALHHLYFLGEGKEEDLVQEHRVIVRELSSGDENRGVTAVANHWKLARERIRDGIARQLLPEIELN